MRFHAVIELGGKTATGIRVPPDVVASLGPGKKYPVSITIGEYTYRSTVAPYRGAFMVSLSAENRAGAGVAAGDDVEVDLVLDTEPREVIVPEDLQNALAGSPDALRRFEGLSYSNKRAHVLAILDAKTPETRARRIAKSVADLHDRARESG